MCGIAGAFSFSPQAEPIDQAVVLRLNELQRRRGPDGKGLWSSGDRRIVLGHRRLAIIDTGVDGAQPMVDATGRWAISFNGEIYNYRALKSELEQLGRVFRTDSDTEVLINVVAQWGEAGLKKLRGMYAFALWDSLERELWLVRDPFGIKPLYVAESLGVIWFASQARPLAACAPVDTNRSSAALTGFYLWGHVPEPFSWWAGIRMFPPGHVQRIKSGGRPPPSREFDRIEDKLSNRPAEPLRPGELRQLLLDSVEHHLVADVPVGVFLSAGVDSGVLSVLASQVAKPLHTVTLGFNEYIGNPIDEVPAAEAVARSLNSDHITVRIGKEEFEGLLDDFLLSMDQPTIDGLNTYLVSRAAASQGLKVAISGLGGDELFGGYPSFRQIPRLLRWGRFAPAWLGRALETAVRAAPFPGLPPKMAGLLSHSGDVASAYLLRRALHLEGELSLLVDGDVLRQGMEQLSNSRTTGSTVEPLRGASDYTKVAALELCWYMRNQLLRDTDWSSMAYSLEVRLPFVDVKVLERLGPLIASNAPPQKRDLAKCAALPHLPERLPKIGFTTPVREWAQSSWGGGKSGERGLRGWAKFVAQKFDAELDLPTDNSAVARLHTPTRSTNELLPYLSKDAVLIFRIGSIGDTVVALPCFHKIASSFPNSRRIVVTNSPVSKKAAPLESVLGRTGLIDSAIYFPPATRNLRELMKLRARIRETKASTLIYMSPRGWFGTVRDICFFRFCGISKIIGAPLSRDLRRERIDGRTGATEREAERLARCLAPLGQIDLTDPALWDLRLLPEEKAKASEVLNTIDGVKFVVLNLGGKVRRKDWGDPHWAELLRLMASEYSHFALVAIGSEDESERSERVVSDWPGMFLNLCGKLTPRESAAVMRLATAFIGHDSGPMHLAAAVGTSCVAIFGDFNPPQKWHPFGAQHHIIHDMRGMERINPEHVYSALRSVAEVHPKTDTTVQSVMAE